MRLKTVKSMEKKYGRTGVRIVNGKFSSMKTKYENKSLCSTPFIAGNWDWGD